MRFFSMLMIAVLGGLIALGINSMVSRKHNLSGTTYNDQLPVHQASYMSAAGYSLPDFEVAAAKSVHAVVHIKTEFQRKSSVYDDFFDFFNGIPGFQSPQIESMPYTATGSGVIIRPDGYIVTNNHVVQESNKIEVTLNDKRTFDATIVGTDPATDLALIKIEATDLPFLTFANSDSVMVGEWVLAVGNPFNLTSTVTAGIVSAKARDINILGSNSAIESFIQTDAAVNPGNSGGALVNTQGDLIGINAAIASGTGNYVGYSFAIPSNIVKKVVDDFLSFGKIQRAYLGVYYNEIDAKFAEDKGLNEVKGVYIEDVIPGGSADEAGLQKGDILLAMNDRSINSKSELLEFVGQHNPGDKVDITVKREGKVLVLPVTLKSESGNTGIVQNDKLIILGATIQPVTEQEKAKYGINNGFKITSLDDGSLRRAGLRVGFIITGIDNRRMASMEDVEAALKGKQGGVLIEGIYPNGVRAYYGVGL